jgi:hypothetical protein
MNKLVLALATLTALSAPALASYPRAHEEMEARHGVSNDAYRHASHMARLRRDEGQSDDPYWAPCDYTTTASPNGCE